MSQYYSRTKKNKWIRLHVAGIIKKITRHMAFSGMAKGFYHRNSMWTKWSNENYLQVMESILIVYIPKKHPKIFSKRVLRCSATKVVNFF